MPDGFGADHCDKIIMIMNIIHTYENDDHNNGDQIRKKKKKKRNNT